MKFSIVTPNYNYGRFLRKAIQSVFDQASSSDMSVEHIVVDGGSTDDSVSILKDWAAFAAAQPAAKDGRYSFSYVSEPDQGQTDAINKGLRRATGDIVAWLNADEWYLPGRLAFVAAAFARHPSTDFLYGEPLFVDKDGNPIRVKWDHWFSKFVLLCHDCHIASCCSFWQRELLAKDGFLDPTLKVAMDYEYWCRLVRHGRRFRFCPHVIGAFIWHDGNVSSSFAEKGRAEVSEIKRRYSTRLVRPLVRSNAGLSFLDAMSHQWRRFLVVLRLMALSKDKLT